MKKILSLILLFSFFAFGQDNTYVQLTYVKPVQGENYGEILNEKWKALAQKRANNGTIIGWDVWWRAGSTPESNHQIMIATLVSHPDSLNVNPGIRSVFPEMTDEEFESFSTKNTESRKIINRTMTVEKDAYFKTDSVPSMLVMNYMKVKPINAMKYEDFESSLKESLKESAKQGWAFHKRVDAVGSGLGWNYLTDDFYNNNSELMSERVPTYDYSDNEEIIKNLSLREHVWSDTYWKWISVRKEN